MKNPKILNGHNEKSICLFQASSNYTYLCFKNGKREISAYTLKVFESLIENHEFIKIDRSNLVRKDFISQIIQKGSVHVVKLINSTEIVIPRRRRRHMMVEYPALFQV
jgi:DNA-binding LytR/AlgR family response regulator